MSLIRSESSLTVKTIGAPVQWSGVCAHFAPSCTSKYGQVA